MSEKVFDLPLSHFQWMALVMVEDIASNPEHIALLCKGSVAPETEDLAHLIEPFLLYFARGTLWNSGIGKFDVMQDVEQPNFFRFIRTTEFLRYTYQLSD